METTPSILLVAKESGMTSFRALSAVKRTLGKKVGHAGTLDKFAQGLLVVLTGSLTRPNPLFMNLDKRYRAGIRFGAETDTLDPDGTVVATAAIPSFDEIKAVVGHFIGAIEQVPPAYSALHVEGRRASDRAREGEVVVMEKRPVVVYHFDLLSYSDGLLEADIAVSKGTYIRSLARDLGLAAGSVAHLESLTRTEIGPYCLDEAVSADDSQALIESGSRVEEYLLRLIGEERRHTCSHTELGRMVYGQYPPSAKGFERSGWALAYDPEGVLRAVLDTQNRKIAAWVCPYEREGRVHETV